MGVLEIQQQIYELEDGRGSLSDGSHSFDELYYHRMILFSVVCSRFSDRAWKSKKHHDGTMYDNYFIVGVDTPEGQYSYHYHLDHWNKFDVVELEFAPEWDGHQPSDVTRLLSLTDGIDDWAKREVELACANEGCYGKACYNSALKAYASLASDGHSGMSIGITRNILNRLISHKPLTPLTGEDDEWDYTITDDEESMTINGYRTYQNKRYSALFKYVYNDGRIRYSDVDQFITYDVNDSSNCGWHCGYINRRLEHLFPITMPYTPPSEPIKVYKEDFLVDPANGDFDTVGIMYLELPDGTKQNINIFLAEDVLNKEFVEITKEEYLERKSRKISIS